MRANGDGEWGSGPRKVLLLHGFSGGPSDLRALGEALASRGFHAFAPELPGHGPAYVGLHRTSDEDWRKAAVNALRRLRGADGQPVGVVGFSLGGALAIQLAAARPQEVGALALLAPALRLSGSSRIYRAVFRWPLTSLLVPTVGKGAPDLVNDGALPLHRDGDRLPTKGARLLDRMIRGARRSLPSVRCPLLVAWGARDRVVPRQAAVEASENAGSRPAPLVVLPRSGHHLALDVDREVLFGRVAEFLDANLPEVSSG